MSPEGAVNNVTAHVCNGYSELLQCLEVRVHLILSVGKIKCKSAKIRLDLGCC